MLASFLNSFPQIPSIGKLRRVSKHKPEAKLWFHICCHF